jgi:hypothetical protein
MADGNAESIAQRIQIARRDAEALKDRIKRKKDELADTTCKLSSRKNKRRQHDLPLLALQTPLTHCAHSKGCCTPAHRAAPSAGHEDQESPQRSSCEDLRHALVDGQEALGIGFTGRQTHHMGCVYYKQGPRDSTPVIMGHDLRIFTQR